MLALLSAGLAIIASLGVLAGSNGSPVATWPTPPSTFIAVFTALGNLSVRYAAFQGVVITWWLKALHGSTVDSLHYDWRAGTSIRGAITAGRRMGWLGVACICSTLVVIDGPLLQRASTVVDAPFSHRVTLNTTMVSKLPIGYSGSWKTMSGTSTLPSFNETMPAPSGQVATNVYLSSPPNAFDGTSDHWTKDDGYAGVIHGCTGECTAKLIAPAVAVKTCVTRSSPRDYNTPLPAQDEVGVDTSAVPWETNAFIVATMLVVDGPQEQINTLIGYSTTEDCVGNFTYTVCTLESAVGEYEVSVRGDTTYIESAESPKILAIADAPVINETYHDGLHWSTLGGVADQMILSWEAFQTLINVNGTMTAIRNGPADAEAFITPSATGGACPDFLNATNAYMASLNKLMVYYGLAAAQGVRWGTFVPPETHSKYPTHATTTGEVTGVRSVFRTTYAYFAGAVVLELMCICLIAPTYWGWWKLGRSVSFSPLEIAKGFEAAILADSNSNATARDLADTHLDQPIRYGALSADGNGGRSRLAFAGPDTAHAPEQRSYYDA